MKYDNLEWRQTPSTSRVAAQPPFKVRFIPRVKPHNLMVGVDNEVHNIKPVEYVIGYCNGLVSIGVARTTNLSSDQPLTMQFGCWKEPLGENELYVGSVVVVKSYYLVSKKMNDGTSYGLRSIVTQGAKHMDMFSRDRLCANSVACDWAIIKKPELKPTLGVVLDFWSQRDANDNKIFYGVVYDQENGEEYNVYNDQWPSYVKREVPKDTPVILNWIQIKDSHNIYLSDDKFKNLFPNRDDFGFELDARSTKGDKWLGWVDTRYPNAH